MRGGDGHHKEEERSFQIFASAIFPLLLVRNVQVLYHRESRFKAQVPKKQGSSV